MRPGTLAILLAVVGIVLGLFLGFLISKGGGRAPVARSMLIVLHPKAGDCQAVFPKKPLHVNKADTFVWEIINTCDSAQSVTINQKQAGNENNVFTTSPPYEIRNIPNDANNPKESETLTIKTEGVQYGRTYDYNVTVGGKTYDPKLEVDP
jgi:hypothetical protein